MRSKKNSGLTAGEDTIAAIITPSGEGGIAAVRVAGPGSRKLLGKLFRASSRSAVRPYLMRHGHFMAASGEVVDEVMAVFMPRGKSYTGEDQAEVFCHGGRQVVRLILDELIQAGARAAEPGEFTKLAFLNGRMDLTRAEAVAEIIAANTVHAYEAGREHLLGAYSTLVEELRDRLISIRAEIEADIDFAEEEIDPAGPQQLLASVAEVDGKLRELLASYTGGRIINEGYKIAIGGRPNAGKSSLFNLLLRHERALVYPTAGTTRDYLSEWVDLDGFAVNLIDTAGLRSGGTVLERRGQDRGEQIIGRADLLLWIFDVSSRGWRSRLKADLERLAYRDILLIANKIDLISETVKLPSDLGAPGLEISCLTGRGASRLRKLVLNRINEKMPDLTSGVVVTSARQRQKLAQALKEVQLVRTMLLRNESPEIVAFELRQAVAALDEITGKVYTEEILGKVFSTFCVGK